MNRRHRAHTAESLVASIGSNASALVSTLAKLPPAARRDPEVAAAIAEAEAVLLRSNRGLHGRTLRLGSALDRWRGEPDA